jgi:RNA polymerase-associated protein LEO1
VFGDSSSDNDGGGAPLASFEADDDAPAQRELARPPVSDSVAIASSTSGGAGAAGSGKAKKSRVTLDVAEPKVARVDAGAELLLFDVPTQMALETVPYGGPDHPVVHTQADSTIRWRVTPDGRRESNARLVRWQDGSLDLMIGNEILPGRVGDLGDGLCYQYVRQGRSGATLLEAHAAINRRLLVVPRSVAGGAVPTRVASVASARHVESKKTEIKLFTASTDPEKDKREKELIEEQRIQVRAFFLSFFRSFFCFLSR